MAYQRLGAAGRLEVENGIVTFLQAHQRSHNLEQSVNQAWVALQVLVAQYQAGLSGIDFNRYATIEQNVDHAARSMGPSARARFVRD